MEPDNTSSREQTGFYREFMLGADYVSALDKLTP